MTRIWLVAAALCALCGVAVAEQKSNSNDLLSAVLTARSAVFAAETSGAGTAEAEGFNADRKIGLDLAHKKSRIEFRFNARTSIAQEFCPDDSKVSIYALLNRANRRYEYFNIPTRPVAMLISNEPQSVAFAPDPTSWAIEDLVQVPGFRDLEKLVNLIESSAAHVGSDITVERREAVVVLTISQKIPASEEGSLNRMTVDFDLSLGGMITLVDWRIQHPKHDADQLLTMQWKRVGTAVIPERRMVHVKATVGGIVKQDDQTLIEFKKFDLAPQDLSTFTVDSLGLADGTNIRDSTNGLRFRYFKGALDEPTTKQ